MLIKNKHLIINGFYSQLLNSTCAVSFRHLNNFLSFWIETMSCLHMLDQVMLRNTSRV